MFSVKENTQDINSSTTSEKHPPKQQEIIDLTLSDSDDDNDDNNSYSSRYAASLSLFRSLSCPTPLPIPLNSSSLYYLPSTEILPSLTPLLATYLSTFKNKEPYNLTPTCGYVQQRDSWSCGYASFNMVLQTHSFKPLSIPLLQYLLERAWGLGLDRAGKRYYGGKIVGKKGGKAWTGPQEWETVMIAAQITRGALGFGSSKGWPGPFRTVSYQTCQVPGI